MFVAHVFATMSLYIVSHTSNFEEDILVSSIVSMLGLSIPCGGGVHVFGGVCALCTYSLFIMSMMSWKSVIFDVLCT